MENQSIFEGDEPPEWLQPAFDNKRHVCAAIVAPINYEMVRINDDGVEVVEHGTDLMLAVQVHAMDGDHDSPAEGFVFTIDPNMAANLAIGLMRRFTPRVVAQMVFEATRVLLPGEPIPFVDVMTGESRVFVPPSQEGAQFLADREAKRQKGEQP